MVLFICKRLLSKHSHMQKSHEIYCFYRQIHSIFVNQKKIINSIKEKPIFQHPVGSTKVTISSSPSSKNNSIWEGQSLQDCRTIGLYINRFIKGNCFNFQSVGALTCICSILETIFNVLFQLSFFYQVLSLKIKFGAINQ